MSAPAETKTGCCWGLLRRRQCLVPTWRGCVALCLLAALGLGLVTRSAYPFLAPSDPKPGGLMVLEGWADDDALRAAVAVFERQQCEKLFLTGGPLERGEPLVRYKTYAELSAASLVAIGFNSNLVQAVPAAYTRQDRTYASARALKRWWTQHGLAPKQILLVTSGPHARRSRLLFEKALGPETEVALLAMPPRNYDPRHWWRFSAGFREVTGELLAYCYARFLFHPRAEDS